MCGIIGYVGNKPCKEILLNGLRQLEYRGYDSAGVCIRTAEGLFVSKSVGKVASLADKAGSDARDGSLGIAHTRWATHGGVTEDNAHPHSDQSGKLYLVHNGIIENYAQLRASMERDGHHFRSQTDTEVLAHLVGIHYERERDLCRAVVEALKHVVGTYGIAVVHEDHPEQMVVARNGSPLLLGRGDGFTIVASDPSAIVEHTNRVVYLNDHEVGCIRQQELKVMNLDYEPLECKEAVYENAMGKADIGEYQHFMLKEIDEQPRMLREAMSGRIAEDMERVVITAMRQNDAFLRTVRTIQVVTCGTAYNAGWVGKYLMEEYCGITVNLEYASEFRYKRITLDPKDTMILFISQSGETADTLAALKEAKKKGFFTFGIVNVVGSTIAREVDAGIYTHAGFEVGVAATKSFMNQLAVLALMTAYLARQRDMTHEQVRSFLSELATVPTKIEDLLTRQRGTIAALARKYARYEDFFFLGRKYNLPMAHEGALKLKEISYVHADAYGAGEMKHGHIALIDPEFPTFFLATQDDVYEKTVSNVQEVKARNGVILSLVNEGDEQVAALSDDVIAVPKTIPALQPMINAVALQLFAYYVALERGCDIDKPRNLAKSVTVE